MNEWESQNLSFSYLPWQLLATELWNTVSFLSWQSWRTPSLIGSLQLFSITLGIWSLDASFSVCSPLWSLLHRLNEHLVEEHLSSSCKISATSLFKKKKKKYNYELTLILQADGCCYFSQERIAKSHGSQCGFCTPGIVMSMYTLLRNKPEPNMEDIEDAFQGKTHGHAEVQPVLLS